MRGLVFALVAALNCFLVAGVARADESGARFERNDLATASSPFLLQHADNPIHWQRWDDDVLAHAKNLDKPIFLSVGYSSCYWCHVMERESFGDEATAAYLNANFVSILVDREERPDIDYLYQNALYAMIGTGGWPLNIFLDTDGTPFWGGTYFPNVERHGMKPFVDLLRLVAKSWREDRTKIATIGQQLRDGFAREADNPGAVTQRVLDKAASDLLAEVDEFYGGFGGAPKYPRPQNLEVLWRAWLRTGDVRYADAVRQTLKWMVRGGLNDHLRGGFARYTIDLAWRQPHFEKMLYTNGLLIRLMTHVWQEDNDAEIKNAIHATVNFVLSQMRTTGGAFASSLDAETGAEEGRFYLWTVAEIDEVLGARSAMFKAAYDVEPDGTFEPEADWLATDYQRSASVLYRSGLSPADLAALGGIAENQVEAELLKARDTLRWHREATRKAPPLDDKVLADWNGVTIRALAEAGFALSEPAWIEAAAQAFDFVQSRMAWRDSAGLERLYHSSRNGTAQGSALVEDYGQMALAALALFEVTGDEIYRDRAVAWSETALARYWDGERGGFFQTADDLPGLVIRVRADYDGELPAGNGGLADVLARVYFFTGRREFADRSEAALKSQGGAIPETYYSLGTLMNAADTLFRAIQVVIIGDRRQEDTGRLLRATAALSLPNRVLQVISPEASLPDGHPAQYKTRIEDKATAYVCVGQVCSLPSTSPAELRETLILMRQDLKSRKTAQ
jgi:hypothetical protein